MKKIFTIMSVAAGTISFASAQSKNSIAYNNKNSNNYNHHATFDNSGYTSYNDAYFSYKEKEAKLEKINHEFDQKIFFVKNDRYLRSRQKAKQIKLLQNQWKNEISKVEFQYAAINHKTDNKNFGHESHKW